MASHSLPIPVPQARDRTQASTANRFLPLGTATAVFVVLLILFVWLRFALSLQVTSTERQILQKSAELDRLQRDNAAIRLKIGEAQSPRKLEERALPQGFSRQQPLYLVLSQPAPEPPSAGEQSTTPLPPSSTGAEAIALSKPSVVESIVSRVNTWLRTEATP